MKRDYEDVRISKVWITGKSSYTIVLPKKFANQLGIFDSSHIVIEKIPSGLLIKKLEIEK